MRHQWFNPAALVAEKVPVPVPLSSSARGGLQLGLVCSPKQRDGIVDDSSETSMTSRDGE